MLPETPRIVIDVFYRVKGVCVGECMQGRIGGFLVAVVFFSGLSEVFFFGGRMATGVLWLMTVKAFTR